MTDCASGLLKIFELAYPSHYFKALFQGVEYLKQSTAGIYEHAGAALLFTKPLDSIDFP